MADLIITPEWIHSNATERGAWTREQLAAIGVAWPPPKGWIAKATGRTITAEQVAAFERNSPFKGLRKSGNWVLSTAGLKSEEYSRPWMTALEMQFATLGLLRGLTLRIDAHKAETVFGAKSLAKSLSKATCFSWSGDTAGAVLLASKTVPGSSGFAASMLPSTHGWWWFENPIILGGTEKCQALAWGPDDDDPGWTKLWIIHERPDATSHNIPIPTLLFRFCEQITAQALLSAKLPDDGRQDDRPIVAHVLRFVLAAIAWLGQRVVVMSDGHVERHRRKQLSREHDAVVSDVKVIQLRRTESQPFASRVDGGEPVEWSCRWIVNGHWRNQPYAEGSKLIYIMPFVKGPADKPLRVPTHTVYAVNR